MTKNKSWDELERYFAYYAYDSTAENRLRRIIRRLLTKQRKEIIEEVERFLDFGSFGDGELWTDRFTKREWDRFIKSQLK